MKSHTEYLWFNTQGKREYINITRECEGILAESGIQEGFMLVNAMHITASVFINDDESGLHHDYEAWLEELAPHAPIDQYWHNRTGEDNADAHLKRDAILQVARDGARGGGRGDPGAARLWHMGAHFLRRV